jgi:hypothetical protein
VGNTSKVPMIENMAEGKFYSTCYNKLFDVCLSLFPDFSEQTVARWVTVIVKNADL